MVWGRAGGIMPEISKPDVTFKMTAQLLLKTPYFLIHARGTINFFMQIILAVNFHLKSSTLIENGINLFKDKFNLNAHVFIFHRAEYCR